jgi:hypothetical protein
MEEDLVVYHSKEENSNVVDQAAAPPGRTERQEIKASRKRL